jgi:hypothetical protein
MNSYTTNSPLSLILRHLEYSSLRPIYVHANVDKVTPQIFSREYFACQFHYVLSCYTILWSCLVARVELRQGTAEASFLLSSGHIYTTSLATKIIYRSTILH